MKGSEGLLSFMMAPVFVRIHLTIYSVESEFGTIKFHVQLILAMFDLKHICCRYFKYLWQSWMCWKQLQILWIGLVELNYGSASWNLQLCKQLLSLSLGEKRLNKFIPETGYFDPGIVSCSWGAELAERGCVAIMQTTADLVERREQESFSLPLKLFHPLWIWIHLSYSFQLSSLRHKAPSKRDTYHFFEVITEVWWSTSDYEKSRIRTPTSSWLFILCACDPRRKRRRRQRLRIS